MKGLGFIHKSIEWRSNRRHIVCWDAILEAKFPDFDGQMGVKVVSFSGGGALLHSEQLTVGNRHLLISDIKPELKLKISLPERVLKLMTRIAWYNVLNEEGTFQIGVSFTNFEEESNLSVRELIKIMEADK